MRRRATVLAAGLLAGAAAFAAADEPALHVSIDAAGHERTDAVVDVPIDPKHLPARPGLPLPLTAQCLDVVEVSRTGAVIDKETAFQLDPVGTPAGTVTILLKGTTKAGTTRQFRLAFRQPGRPFAPRKVPSLIELADSFEHRGQESYRIVTGSAWWYYHKKGAGFAGLEDRDGKDWISYRPQGGSDGRYRGIPNLVHPEGHFHPGGTKCTSRLLAAGPLKAIIDSQSADGKWSCRWEIAPAWARLTVLKAAGPYWFLYEGTPGGSLEEDRDFCLRSDGTKAPASKRWTADLPAPEWVCFGDPQLKRCLWLVHHGDDGHVDSYWPMQRNMTVFGFGRDGLKKLMTRTGEQFTVGFCESTDPKVIAATIDAAFRPYRITVRQEKEQGK